MVQQFRKYLIYSVALCWVGFQIYVCFAAVPGIVLRPLHVSFMLILSFMLKPFSVERKKLSSIIDAICVILSFVNIFYILYYSERLLNRIQYVDEIYSVDMLMGTILIILILEAGRRFLGWSMTIVSSFFISYALLGKDFPGIFRHAGMDVYQFIENQTMTVGGIYSSPIAVTADTVFYFMIFGAFLAATPAGKLFLAIAQYLTRKTIGGAAKASIIASGLFGMISGSAAANVATVGVISYPMMERAKFRPVFSAALLATAGTGGQLIPPVMGAAAFIMADMIGVSYFKIILCAILPSLLYVASLVWAAHLESLKENIVLEKIDVETVVSTIKNYIYLLLPIGALVLIIAYGYSLMRAGMVSTTLLIILCQIRKSTRMSLKDILMTCIDGAKQCVAVSLPCALAGVVIGVVVNTGLGIRFSALIASFSEGNLLLALLLATVMIIIMGMGMPTSAAYIMSAILLAPAMQNLGVQAIVAHMFIFYFANMSMITPPVAIASYTAAGIAKTGLWETGIEGVKVALILFLIPYVFVYNPALLGLGSIIDICIVFFTCSVGVFALGISVMGYWKRHIPAMERVAFAAGAMLLIIPETLTDLFGLGVVILLVAHELAISSSKQTKAHK